MSKQLNKYRSFCSTESKFYESWSETIPTTCPNGHSIEQSLTNVIDTMAENQVFIASKTYNTTKGYYQMKGTKIAFAAGEESKTFDVTYPFPTCIVGLICHTTDEQKGDHVDIAISPDTPVGITLQSAAKGTNQLTVNETVVQNVLSGFNIIINGTNLGQVSNVDQATSTISLVDPLPIDIGAGQIVCVSIYLVKDFYFATASKYLFGYGMNATKPVPANTIIRMYYTRNNPTNACDVYLSYEYTY